jgi:superfamily II DNA/RNA helicase
MPLTNGEGPIGLIICPSRELARQVRVDAALIYVMSRKCLM